MAACGGAGRGAGGEGRYLESVWSRASRAKCRQAALTLVKLPDMVSHDVIIISTDVTNSHHPTTKPSNCLIQTCGEWETSVTILLRLAPAEHRGPVAPWHCIHEWPVSPKARVAPSSRCGVEAVASPPTILILFQPIIMDLTMRGCWLSASTVTPQAKTINTAHCCCKTKLAFH